MGRKLFFSVYPKVSLSTVPTFSLNMHIHVIQSTVTQRRILICDRVYIKGPFVGNLKNEIIKFYDKLGFKASFP